MYTYNMDDNTILRGEKIVASLEEGFGYEYFHQVDLESAWDIFCKINDNITVLFIVSQHGEETAFLFGELLKSGYTLANKNCLDEPFMINGLIYSYWVKEPFTL